MPEPLITIGITCYNEGGWLLECWESLLAQTDDRWVAVLVMDGTKDQRTLEIFDQLEHPKLRKTGMPTNMGPYPTRNKAFELTETPYHFYLDGDDQLLPNSVSLVIKSFTQHPNVGFVYGDYEFFGNRSEVQNFPQIVTANDFVERQPIPGPCAYKKQVWEHLGGFSTELAQGNGDYDFLIGAIEAGFKGYHCGQVFYRYRVGHATKVSKNYRRQYHETHEIIVRRHPHFFNCRRRRNRFLAQGYKRAARWNYAAGDVKRAFKLVWSAMWFGMWNDRELWSMMLKNGLHSWVFLPLRMIWRLGNNAKSGFRKHD